jgi:hypothetical protein
MKPSTVVALVVIGLLYAVAAHATPWFTQDPRTLPEGKWRVEEHVIYSSIDEGLANGDAVPLPGGVTDASALTLHTRIRYGVRDDLTVFIDLPWVDKQVDTPSGDLDNDGLGDVQFVAKWKYHEDKEAGQRRAIAFTGKFETGEHEGLSPLLAPGTGQNDYGLTHLWEWRHGGATWYGNVGYILKDERADTNVNPGDWLVMNLAAEHQIGDSPVNFVWELNGRHEWHNRAAGLPVPNSGATIVALSPGFQYVSKKPNGRTIALEAGVQVPFFKHGDLPALPDYTVYAGGYAIF